jgi:hypothetical protein
MLSFKECATLLESYPEGFSMENFNKIASFAGKMRYCMERLPRIGRGSSRSVFKVDETNVLKLARNKKGIAQNRSESDFGTQSYAVCAKVFDSDRNDYWVEMELAKKLTPKRFEEIVGVSISAVDQYLRHYDNREYCDRQLRRVYCKKTRKQLDDDEFIVGLMSFAMDYDMSFGDLGVITSYGEVMREGKPSVVLIDFGATKDVMRNHYNRVYKPVIRW